ncbi:TetR/AcrR family transcriptional regulator, partial [Escherichia coli]|nr:TetR/AcrR family transcriptional regulator [Escherichia coli]
KYIFNIIYNGQLRIMIQNHYERTQSN